MPPKKRKSAGKAWGRRRSAAVKVVEPEEDESIREDDEDVQEDAASPPVDNDAEEEEDVEAEDEVDLDDEGTPAQDSPDGDEEVLPVRSFQRAGRPKTMRGARPEDWGTPEPVAEETPPRAMSNTPRRGRGRGRGRGFAAARARFGKPNRGPSHTTQVPIDKEGNMMDVVDDEVDLPEDPDGETKVNKDGALQDGREYRVRTFKLVDRGDRLFMLSTEPARCTGFRDSYLFFAKHPTLYKIIVNDEEKKDLIDRELIPHSYKGRAIGVVTARSVFREFGCKIIVGGRKVVDDYKVAEARARGDKEGDLADPTDAVPPPGRTYNRNQYVAWHGASSVYHTSNAPAMPQGAKSNIMGKRKANLTAENWLLEHARAASQFNSALNYGSKLRTNNCYETYTNYVFRPAATQPTHARWEVVQAQSEPPAKKRKMHNGLPNGDSVKDADVVMTNGYHHDDEEAKETDTPDTKSIFPPLSSVLSRNFVVADTIYESPAYANFSTPGTAVLDRHPVFKKKIQGAPPLSKQEAIDLELPQECIEALKAAQAAETEWTSSWSDETRDGLRPATIKIGYGF